MTTQIIDITEPVRLIEFDSISLGMVLYINGSTARFNEQYCADAYEMQDVTAGEIVHILDSKRNIVYPFCRIFRDEICMIPLGELSDVQSD